MPIETLDHVNLRTTQLDTMIAWYTDVLGLRHGERPDSSSRGAWIYAGNRAVVHLVEVEGEPGIGAETALKLEHFAFSATGLAEFEATLRDRGEAMSRSEISAINVVQMNVWDPDGNHIHVDFPSDE